MNTLTRRVNERISRSKIKPTQQPKPLIQYGVEEGETDFYDNWQDVIISPDNLARAKKSLIAEQPCLYEGDVGMDDEEAYYRAGLTEQDKAEVDQFLQDRAINTVGRKMAIGLRPDDFRETEERRRSISEFFNNLKYIDKTFGLRLGMCDRSCLPVAKLLATVSCSCRCCGRSS